MELLAQYRDGGLLTEKLWLDLGAAVGEGRGAGGVRDDQQSLVFCQATILGTGPSRARDHFSVAVATKRSCSRESDDQSLRRPT